MRASVIANRDYKIATIDDRLYGAFLEHLGRAIYTGIYEPDHQTADANGMRGTSSSSFANSRSRSFAIPAAISSRPTIGKTASARARSGRRASTSPGTRPSPTQVGVHEFADWCESAGTEMMLAINLGSRGLDQARNFVEYVNGPTGSDWGDLRKANGRAEPFGRQALVPRQRDGRPLAGRPQDRRRIWPPRQRDGQDAARLRQLARAHRLRLVALRHADLSRMGAHRARAHLRRGRPHLAAHVFRQPRARTPPNYLALNAKLDAYIGTVASTIEFVKRQEAQPKRTSTISFDEWNVWYHSQRAGSRDPRRQQGLAACAARCSRTSTISRTCCRSAASSTPSSAAPTW